MTELKETLEENLILLQSLACSSNTTVSDSSCVLWAFSSFHSDMSLGIYSPFCQNLSSQNL